MTKPANATPVPVLLCADDFGISRGVDRAILELAALGRLSAVTCMSLGESWAEDAPALKACGVAAGLHVTLTYLPPLVTELGARLPAEKELGVRSWLRLLDADLIEKEIRAQFSRFIAVWGAAPDFIDGHQHVHVLPVVRDIVLRLRDEYAPGAWVRNVCDFSAGGIKSTILNVMGFRFRRLLEKRGIAFNAHMRGPHDYAGSKDFGALMEDWRRVPGALIYCHPGFPDAELARYDAVLEPRRREYEFLKGDVFGGWLGTEIKLVSSPGVENMPENNVFAQLKRFVVTGGVNTVFAYLVYAFLAGALDMGYMPALALSWTVSVLFSYATFRAFVFTGGDRGFRSFARFIPTYVVLLAVNMAGLYALVDMAGWNKLAAQAVIVPCCAALSFVINRAFVFRAAAGDA